MLESDENASGNTFPLMAEKPPELKKYVRFSLIAAVLWLMASWFFSGRYMDWQISRFVDDAKQKINKNIADVASVLEENLAIFHGIPAIIGRDETISKVLKKHRAGFLQKPFELSRRKALWSSMSDLNLINALLAQAANDVPAFSIVWLIDADGDCIAASNAGTPSSFVGTNYSDREYFKAAAKGQKGRQFAVGRVTGIPGLFFSAPVYSGSEFLGLVVVKIDLPYLATWVDQFNAFITDNYGVIILAHEKSMEMRSVPSASINALSPKERMERYRQTDFPEVAIKRWTQMGDTEIFMLNDGDMPYLRRSRNIAMEDMSVTVMQPIPEFATQVQDHRNFFALTAMSGLLLIGVGSAAFYYLTNFQRARRYREYQRQIEYMASHDSLTGLFNRAVIDQLVQQGIATAERSRRLLGVLFLDMDMFKDINDSMGHEAGDLVLREVAQRLRSNLRASDSVVRHGGDEFVILLNDLETPDNAAHLTDKLLQVLRMPFILQGVTLNLSASIGVALYPDDGDSASALLSNADSALYRAKANGRSEFCFYHASMNADIMAHLSLENELRDALAENQFVIHYQPQYSLSERRVIGCEALVRWQHPVRGLLYPAEFLSVAEKSGLIVALGEWVLRKACFQASTWRQDRLIDFPVAVNLSAIQFRKPGLLGTVQLALSDAGLAPGGLELELTESAMMANTDDTIRTMQALKVLGVSLSIDDFGTGYSSLSYLKRFEPDVLKIDRSFVRDVETDANDLSVVDAIIGLGKSLNYRVIAEGIETDSQLQLLKQRGCHEIQGYWFSRPLVAADFSDFMKNPLLSQSLDTAALPEFTLE